MFLFLNLILSIFFIMIVCCFRGKFNFCNVFFNFVLENDVNSLSFSLCCLNRFI